jgi:hypothetical protein
MEKESKTRVDGSLQSDSSLRKKHKKSQAYLKHQQGKMGRTEGVYFEQNKPI